METVAKIENWFFIGALLVISVFGILGNAFVIYVVIKKKLLTKKYGIIC